MTPPDVHVLILGPVLVRRGAQTVAPSAPLTRTIVGVLALAGAAGLSVDALAESAWPQDKPPVGGKALVVAVHRARQWLAGHTDGRVRIERTTTGYTLVGAEIDADRFTRLAAHPGGLAEALGLWRGEPLADAMAGQSVAPAIEALTRTRLTAATEHGRRLLAAGRAGDALALLTPLVDVYPLDEPLHAVLVEALASVGRQAEALDRYERLRLRLADELGVDPSRELSGTLVRVLRQEIPQAAREPIAPAGPVPAQLPPDVGIFTGRVDQLGQLDALAAAASGGSVVISALAGIGGVGKTTLAAHWAHRVADTFPDGQLYIDLRGYAQVEPVQPIEALGRFLRALGVSPERVPVVVDEASALFRTMLAGKRLLVVADNVHSADQVRPLLPASPGCLALVTSRDRLDGLVAREGAHRLSIDVFAPGESTALLVAMLGADRVAAEPAAAAELAELCGHLPLALRITAAHLMGRPSLSIAGQVRALRADRLMELAIAEDPMSSVRAVFDLSYARLSDADRRVFRLLGIAPGTDISVPAVTVLCGSGAAASLERLVAAHLVRQDDGRYSCHDLVREYARARAEAEDAAEQRKSAVETLCHWYLDTADTAARLLHPNDSARLDVPPVVLTGRLSFDSDASAEAWLRTEMHQLISVIEHTAKHGPPEISWLLADAIRRFTHGMGQVELLHALQASYTAAVDARDLTGQAAIDLSLTLVYVAVGPMEKGTTHAARAVTAARGAGWVEGTSVALTLLASALMSNGDFDEAEARFNETIEYAREHGLIEREIAATHNLAHFYWGIGELHSAADCTSQVVAHYRQGDNLNNVVAALDSHAQIQHDLGELHNAAATLAEALTLSEVNPRRRHQSWVLNHLAEVHVDLGRYDQARDFAARERSIAGSLGDGHACRSMISMARADLRQGKPADAVDGYRAATLLAQRLGQIDEEIDATVGWAMASHDLGDDADALQRAQNALAMAHRHQFRLSEAGALTVLAAIHLRRNHLDWAVTHAERALTICQKSGARLRQAKILRLLGEIRLAQHQNAAAISHLRAAEQLFTEIDIPEADELRAIIAQHEQGLPHTGW
jgi:DNA-binding SARP family transcriptional activator/tetratricopeptide (TPR) repeat protein